MTCTKCDTPMHVLPSNDNDLIKVYRCSNQQCRSERQYATCHICNQEHALFEANVNDSGTWNLYLLCANCIEILKHSETQVRY